MANRTQQVLRGVNTKLDANPFTKSGYTFLGWSTDKTATKADYDDQGEYSFTDDETTLYAIWDPNRTIVGAFGLCTHINGYSSETMGAIQHVGDATGSTFNWRDNADTNILAITDVGWSGGKFIRTAYKTVTGLKPQYSTDGIYWTNSDSKTKMARMAFCCGGMYEN